LKVEVEKDHRCGDQEKEPEIALAGGLFSHHDEPVKKKGYGNQDILEGVKPDERRDEEAP
jgi:hypothetical protein